MEKVFSSADILIPKNINMQAWSVVACDQHTSDIKYWQDVKNLVGDNPSTLNLIVPEVYLGSNNQKLIDKANANMQKVLNSNIFSEYKNSIIYVERNIANGKVRKGIVGKIDLEKYSANVSDNTVIKASEEIVESRVPTRVEIRKNASLDFPHVLLFCDDKNKQIIESLHNKVTQEQKLYDFNLNMNGGRIVGYKLNDEQTNFVEEKINALMLNGATGLIVADGNHSLVAAKRVYEEVKKIDANYLNSPKRYALVEIVNIYDEAIDIEPIHRVLKNIDCNNLFSLLKTQLPISKTITNNNLVKVIFGGKEIDLVLDIKQDQLPVEIIQQFLDEYLINHGGEIDYIHELDKLKLMCKEENCLGIVFAPIVKADIFKVISNKKVFPRKTFSIGTSLDKRYYLESRKLIK